MKSHFGQVVDLSEHDNSEIKRAVLPHTELKYERALHIYDHVFLTDFSSSQATSSGGQVVHKAFMEFYSKNTPGRLDERPTVGTIEDFRAQLRVSGNFLGIHTVSYASGGIPGVDRVLF
ncbi:hypothetical protein V8E54_001096 [Elaphomyces granulatus]